MKKQRKILRRKINKIKLFIICLLFLLIGISTAGYVWYESRAIPDLNEQNQMTILPPDMRNTLGAETGPSSNPQSSFRVPIFLYHYVEYVHNDPGRQNLNIPPDILTSQIDTLKSASYTFITPNDLMNALSGKERISTRSAILSFDDGYMDFYTDVYPILQKEHVKAIAYIVPNFLDRPNYMFTFQLEEVAKNPLIEIGAHSMNHYALAGVNTKNVTYEIAQSRKVLQDLLHLPINSFAYPYGSFDKSTIKVVMDAGYTNAVSVLPGIIETPENKYFLYRLRPGYRSGQALLKYLNQDDFQPW